MARRLHFKAEEAAEREFSAHGTTAGEVIVLDNSKGSLLGLPPPGALG